MRWRTEGWQGAILTGVGRINWTAAANDWRKSDVRISDMKMIELLENVFLCCGVDDSILSAGG
ncbi:hypothetical protein GRD98_19425 (plasmid) [Ralstonia solanacearum]|nr:hypothetical protein GRD98_19425 [Ralstonia solanacearum]